MAIINYKYGEMLEKANELDSVLPSLLEEGNWEKIRAVLVIPETIWSGPAADTFAHVSDGLCDAHSDGILELSGKLRNAVTSMQEADRAMAARVRNMFGCF